MTSQTRTLALTAILALTLFAAPGPAAASVGPVPVGAAGATGGVAECVAVPTFAEAAASGVGTASASATAGTSSSTDGPRFGAAATFAFDATALSTSSSASVSGTLPVLGGAFSASVSCAFYVPPLPSVCKYLEGLQVGARTVFGQDAASYDGEILEDAANPGTYFFQGSKRTDQGTVSFTKGFDENGRLILQSDGSSDAARPGITWGCPHFKVDHSASLLNFGTTAKWV